MAATGADRKIPGLNRANLIEFRGVAPDIDEFLPPHVSAGERKLHAGKNISVRRNVSQSVTRAAGILFHCVFGGNRRGRAEFFYISHQAFVMKYLTQFRARNTQVQD
jgi:hypothetical protein